MKLTFRNIVTSAFLASGLVLVLLSRKWVSAEYVESGFPNVSLDLTANELTPALSGLAIAAIASTLGAIATRGFGRRLVGVVMAVIGIGIAFVTFDVMQNLEDLVGSEFADAIGRDVSGWSQESSIYAWLVIPAGLVIAICGLLMAGKTFDTRLSKRYERELGNPKNLTPWQSLDQGIDPTIESEIR
jgi:uncharacterized membrane protein (TIGR02234 family)